MTKEVGAYIYYKDCLMLFLENLFLTWGCMVTFRTLSSLSLLSISTGPRSSTTLKLHAPYITELYMWNAVGENAYVQYCLTRFTCLMSYWPSVWKAIIAFVIPSIKLFITLKACHIYVEMSGNWKFRRWETTFEEYSKVLTERLIFFALYSI